MNHIQAFVEDMRKNGVITDKPVFDDGKLHRFYVCGDKRGTTNGWYLLHNNNSRGAVGRYGTWKQSGVVFTWSARAENGCSHDSHENHKRLIQAAAEKRELDKQLELMKVAERCQIIWNYASYLVPIDHPYLKSKGVGAYCVRQIGDALVVPLHDEYGKLWSLQYIYPDGKKLFHAGGRTRGCFSLIGEFTDPLYIVEGYATGATIHEETNMGVAIAFNANNLKPVAEAIRAALPENHKIIIAADNDRYSPNNPGITKGREAAIAIDAEITWPHFPDHMLGSDFNDLRQLTREGLL